MVDFPRFFPTHTPPEWANIPDYSKLFGVWEDGFANFLNFEKQSYFGSEKEKLSYIRWISMFSIAFLSLIW